eukprot:4460104-Pyramimonas_sp.AAC.1
MEELRGGGAGEITDANAGRRPDKLDKSKAAGGASLPNARPHLSYITKPQRGATTAPALFRASKSGTEVTGRGYRPWPWA